LRGWQEKWRDERHFLREGGEGWDELKEQWNRWSELG